MAKGGINANSRKAKIRLHFRRRQAGAGSRQEDWSKTGMTGKKGGKVRKKLKKGGVKRKHHGGRVSGGMKDKQC